MYGCESSAFLNPEVHTYIGGAIFFENNALIKLDEDTLETEIL